MRPISLVRRGMVATRQLSTSGLLTTQRNKLLIIELNRPKALNALNLEMCQEMNELLRHKINGTDGGVAAFLVKGVGGKAFCAGGDVKTVWQELTAGQKCD